MTGIIAGDRVLPADALTERIARAATGFRALDIGEGDTIALVLRNDFAFFEASLAAGLVGAYATPINWHATPDEAGYVLSDCGAKLLVVHADLYPRIASAVPAGIKVFGVSTPPEIAAAYGLEAGRHGGLEDWDAWVAVHAPLTAPPPRLRASMIYTSGTTGRPKGVRRAPATPDELAAAFARLKTNYGLARNAGVTVLMNGPMYHSAPNSYGLNAARLGATIVLQPRFDAEEMLALIERHRITHMHVVPTMFVRLLRLPDAVRAKYDLSSLRFVVHGAAPCPVAVKRAMIEWWGPVINEYYGSTETGIPVWHNSRDALAKPGTVGRVLPGATVKVFDAEGRELPPGGIGEIYIRVSSVPDFTYHGQEARRAEVGRDDLVTVGDVGWVDDDGFVFLCDRKRDMVISGGVNIYPAEIESVLIGMPGVHDCAVFGIPDEEFGESLCACVEPEAGVALDAAAVRAWLMPRVAGFKVPKRVEIAHDLPREDSGKIFKRKLREPYWAKAGRVI